MNTNPLVSIVIPTRNRGALLARCLDSIQAQSYENYEVLVLDDGSSSEHRQMVRELMQRYDRRMQLHEIHAPDTQGSGASVIRNKGIALAKGDYITFCDDDDVWCREDHLATAITTMGEHQAQAYFAGIRIEDPAGNTLVEKMLPKVESTLKPEQQIADDVYKIPLKQMLAYPDYAHLDITIVSKALLDKIGGFWEQTCYAEDINLFLRICDAAEVILFRPEICAIHFAPAKRSDHSVSNSLSHQNKRLLEVNAFQHLLMTCSKPLVLAYARISLADLYKMICEELKAEGKNASAIHYAQCALAIYPTMKWAVYIVWLYISLALK